MAVFPISRHRPLGFYVAIALISLAGACLRIAAARGDLWLDEIWTFRLLDDAPSIATIVFGLPHDNNHVLTTVWLAAVGPGASPLLVRLPAIVFGSLCAPVAARIGARQGAATALAAAAVFAFDDVFVHFGSEARGYSGLILAVLIALDALDDAADAPAPWNRLIVFAVAVAFGTFSHLTMVEPTFVLCATAVLSRDRRGRAGPIALAAVAGTLPAVLCFAISVMSGVLHRGLVTPFSFEAFGSGLGRIARATIGLPDGTLGPTTAAVLLAALAASVVVALATRPRGRRPFYALAIIGLPLLHIALRLPNQQYPRFHLTAAIALALLGAEVWGAAWQRRNVLRGVAIAAGLLFLTGQTVVLTKSIQGQRGHYADAVAFLGARGPATVTVLPPIQAGETNATIRWYAGRSGRSVMPIDTGAPCGPPADWLVVVQVPNETADDATAEDATAEDACHNAYVRQARFPAYGLSGFTWTVFRKRAGG